MTTARLATQADGIPAGEASRRTTYAVSGTEDGPVRAVVRTRFTSPTTVEIVDSVSDDDLAAVMAEVTYWSPQVREILANGCKRPVRDARPLEWVPLAQLTVGQLTVDAAKLAACDWVSAAEDVVLCVAQIDGELMVVDGHTRAVAAWRKGIRTVGVVLDDTGPLQRVTKGWCRDAGIVTVTDLARHVVATAEHQKRWVGRCQRWLQEQRDWASGQVRVGGDDLCFRSATADDADQLTRWWNDGAVMAHAGFPHRLGTTLKQVSEKIAENELGPSQRCVIEEDGRLVGELNYRIIEDRAEIGIKLCEPSAQDRGLGTRLLQMLIAHLFSHQQIDRIELDTDLSNRRAQHVYAALGFHRQGVRHDAWRDQTGTLRSVVDYTLTREVYSQG